MIIEIKTIEDVKIFTRQLMSEDVSFHPDDDFNDYVSLLKNKPTYNKIEADLRNSLMKSCFKVCENAGVDVYDVMNEICFIETVEANNALIPNDKIKD